MEAVAYEDLASRALALAETPVSQSGEGLDRVGGGMSHDVFRASAPAGVIVKVFRPHDRHEAQREWDALNILGPLAPRPLAFVDAPDRPVVIMEEIPGVAKDPAGIDDEAIAAIANAHRQIHELEPAMRRPANSHPSTVLVRTQALLSEWPSDETPAPKARTPDVSEAARAAKEWLSTTEASGLAVPPVERFCRGDTFLTNYLWHEGTLRLIDFEDSGMNDPAFEIADMAEHVSARSFTGDTWTRLAEATGIADASRIASGRRLLACFWLAILERRSRRGQSLVFQVSLTEQAAHLLKTLS